ncbi:MAG: hypothetical protein DHS20C17_26490 [Cyclobacteriaceae bacterium]|nr:MAG: hypothetical protein DHS20C17_26490 [Cyclobacteriaceae bacterium]
MTNLAIKTENLTKRYGSLEALKGVDLEVPPGFLFGIIGPDGAGKTSLIRTLATLVLPDGGRASVLGHDVVAEYRSIRNKMGYMPGRFSLYQDLSVLENLQLFASIYDTTIEKNYHLIKDIYQQIEPFKHRRAGQLSGGMKQKLALSCALIHEPEILFLDEPTTGVDPVSRNEFWEMLEDLKKKGISILVSTPYMDEAKLCDMVALIQNGTILSVNTPAEIVDSYNTPLYAIKATNKYQLLKDLKSYSYAASVFPFGEYIHYTDQRGLNVVEELKKHLEANNHSGIEVVSIAPTVEDCFMALMDEQV